MKTPKDMHTGVIHKTNLCGDIEILSYKGCNSVTIKFRDTGGVVTVQSESIRKGSVRDPLIRTAYGIGFIGVGKFSATKGRVNTKEYDAWRDMFRRCYSPDFHARQPTYKGCTVSKEWHDFQNFAEWYTLNIFDGGCLDKDIKVSGNKVYSPETCLIVTKSENTKAAHDKVYHLTSPSGEVITITGMTDLCNAHNLSQSCMSQVANGKRKSHKGFSLAYVSD